MAEQFAEESYPGTTRLWFPEGVAPFGELSLMRADHGRERDVNSPAFLNVSPALQVAAPRIVREAWGHSEWLRSELNDESLTNFIKDEGRDDINVAIANAFNRAVRQPLENNAWFAVRPPTSKLDEGDALIKGLGQFIMPKQVVGFANAKQDVSGNALQQAVKRLKYPEKVYAAVSNMAVLPAEQHKYIGSALLYTSLGLFRPQQYPTTYVAASNKALIESLGNLSYEPTGSQIRKDLIPGAEIEEVRLQAKSVKEVRNRLAARFSWLTEAIPAYPTQRA